MKNLPAALLQLRRFHLLASILIIGFLLTIAGITWASRASTAEYQSRINIINHQVHTPGILLGQISLLDESEQAKGLIKTTLDQWVSYQEVLQKGDPSILINNPADPQILTHFQLIDPGFRRVVKTFKDQLTDTTIDKASLITEIQAYAGEYEIGMIGIRQMWTTGYQRLNSWSLISQMILILTTMCLILLESMFIGKPVLGFLESNIRRKETLKDAERSHLKVVRELSVRKKTNPTPAIGKKIESIPTEEEQKLSDQFPARILVVEDHPANQKYVQKLFQKLGYFVDLASNGREAVGKALTESYDLIFMDIQMPIMDGIQASYEILGSLEEHEQPVIIALTGSAEPEIQEQCLDVGMKDIIWKPVKRDQVTEAIIKWHKVTA